MKKRFSFLLVLALVLALAGCSSGEAAVTPTPASVEVVEVDHTDEWKAQADEIRPLMQEALSAVLPSKWGGEARVSNQKGEVVIKINTFNKYLTFQDYAEVVKACCDKYFELVGEYEEYSFSPISISYIAEDASLIVGYTVDESGVGEFEEDRIKSFTLSLTPEEVYNRLQDTLDYIS